MTPIRSRDPVVRLPHWLTARARDHVAAQVSSALRGADLHPVIAVLLQDVLTELQVASARDAVWPEPGIRVRQATGLPADAVAVRFSAAELTTVLDVPGLPESVHTILSRGYPAP